MAINVVNVYKHKPTKNDVYIGRGKGSVLGNPYTSRVLKNTKAEFQVETNEEAVAKYEEYILKKIEEKDEAICNELNRIYKIAKTDDVNLVCFCKPKPCHGDVIKRIIDEKIPKT